MVQKLCYLLVITLVVPCHGQKKEIEFSETTIEERAAPDSKSDQHFSEGLDRFISILGNLNEPLHDKEHQAYTLAQSAIEIMNSNQDIRLSFRLLQEANNLVPNNQGISNLFSEFAPHLAFAFPDYELIFNHQYTSFETDGKYVFMYKKGNSKDYICPLKVISLKDEYPKQIMEVDFYRSSKIHYSDRYETLIIPVKQMIEERDDRSKRIEYVFKIINLKTGKTKQIKGYEECVISPNVGEYAIFTDSKASKTLIVELDDHKTKKIRKTNFFANYPLPKFSPNDDFLVYYPNKIKKKSNETTLSLVDLRNSDSRFRIKY